MADRIESEICNCDADSVTEVRDIDKDKYTEQFQPKGTVRVSNAPEKSDPTSDNYTGSNG